MNNIKNIIIVIFCIAITGCSPNYYPGIWGSRVAPAIRELNGEMDGSAKVFGIDAGNIDYYNKNESNYMMRAQYRFIKSSKYTNANFGFFSYLGSYHVNEVKEYKGNKGYFGIGPEGHFNIQFPIDKTTLGLGMYYGFGFEFGEYYNFRQTSDDEGLADNNAMPLSILFALYPYIGHQISENKYIGFQIALGLPGNVSPSILFQSEDYYYWASWAPSSFYGSIYNNRSFTLGFGLFLK